jgi:hypothetical protein
MLLYYLFCPALLYIFLSFHAFTHILFYRSRSPRPRAFTSLVRLTRTTQMRLQLACRQQVPRGVPRGVADYDRSTSCKRAKSLAPISSRPLALDTQRSQLHSPTGIRNSRIPRLVATRCPPGLKYLLRNLMYIIFISRQCLTHSLFIEVHQMGFL